ncbi:hypothetical protein AKJ16_DCAP22290 [Drosera capensis]
MWTGQLAMGHVQRTMLHLLDPFNNRAPFMGHGPMKCDVLETGVLRLRVPPIGSDRDDLFTADSHFVVGACRAVDATSVSDQIIRFGIFTSTGDDIKFTDDPVAVSYYSYTETDMLFVHGSLCSGHCPPVLPLSQRIQRIMKICHQLV